MIGFLYPVLALAALAAVIPVILHLLRRREARRVIFPALRYLRQAEQRHARKLRLRHLLLLGARVSIILLAAAAAAGPLIGRGGAADHLPTALALIIDDSQSSAQIVGELRILDLLVQRADLALELLNPDDRVAVFSASRPDRGAVATGPAAARDFVQSLQPLPGRARLPDAIAQARAWLGSIDDRARELHVLTDMQRVSLTDAGAAAPLPPEGGRGLAAIVYSPDVEPAANGTVAAPIPEVLPLSAGRQTRVSVPLRWFGPGPPSEPVIVRLIEGNDVTSVAEGRFGSVALLRLPPQDSGWVRGYVEITRHGLAADDRRHFAWFARPPVRLATAGEIDSFLEHALSALERGGRLNRLAPSEAEVWLADTGSRVEQGLALGKSVVVIPPQNPLDLPRLNSRLRRARIPWRYEARDGRGVTRLSASTPLEGLGGLEVRRYYRLRSSDLAPRDTALIRLDDGEPWLIRGKTESGSAYILLASPFNPDASDIAVSAAMVPLVDALVGAWARRGLADMVAVEGVGVMHLPARARQVEMPDGSTRDVEGGAGFQPLQAGTYTISDGRTELAAFAVNAPLEEADLSRGERAELANTLPEADWSWSVSLDKQDWASEIFRARRGKLTWRPLVVLLLLVSIVEATVAAAGRREPVNPAARHRSDRQLEREQPNHP